MQQLFRYGVVGVLQNTVSYLCYLLLVWWGLTPQAAITLLYPLAVTASYLGNRQWAFSHEGKISSSFFRFIFAHLCGYGINIALLSIFVDRLSFPHELVQAASIFVVAAFLFLMLRYFVFPKQTSGNQ